MSDTAILHDQLRAVGGAEVVAFELAREFDAPIYAAAVDPEVVPEDVEAVEIFDSPVGDRLVRAHYLVADLYQMLAWQHVDELFEYQTLILNKNNPGWFVPGDTQTVVKYCHSTPRSLYDRWEEFGGPMWKRALRTPMRVLERTNVTYPDAWIANSELVARRIERYYDIEPTRTVYPPVDVDSFPVVEDDDGYYLTLSRLHPGKCIDEIVRAWEFVDVPLFVAGDGPERERLEGIAPGHVTFLGRVSEREKRRLFANARAFVMNARNEDFGIAPIEAFAAGTPVLGVEEGFTQHQILHGANGYHFERGELADAVRRIEIDGVEWSAEEMARFADRFATSRFRKEMRDVVEAAREQSLVRTPWEDERSKPTQTIEVRSDGSWP